MKSFSHILLKYLRFGLACALINNQLRRICSLTLVFLLAITIFPAKLFAHNHKHEERYGGTFSVGMAVENAGMHPIFVTRGLGGAANLMIHMGFFDIHLDMSIEPMIAESWTCNEKRNYCDLKIKDNIFFHDGEKLNVDDIIFTYDMARKFDLPQVQPIFEFLEEYEEISSNQIRMKLSKYSNEVWSSVDFLILPKHVYDGVNFSEEFYRSKVVGAGPFVYEGQDKKKNIFLKANENFHLGRPYFDKVVLKPYFNNNDLWGAMLKGDIDLAMYLRPEDIGVLEEDASFKIFKSPIVDNKTIFLNYSKALNKDVRFRKALSYAIDRSSIVERLLFGYGDIYPQIFESTKDSKPSFDDEYSWEKVKTLLEEIGMVYNQNKNVWLHEGKVLQFKLLVFSEFKNELKFAMLLRQNLSKFGIRLNVVKKSYAQVEEIAKQEVDGVLWGLNSILPGDYLFTSDSMLEILKNYNCLAYSSDSLSQMRKEYSKIITDKDKLFSLEKKIENYLLDNYVFVYLYSSTSLHALRSDIKNAERFFAEEDLQKIMYLYREK